MGEQPWAAPPQQYYMQPRPPGSGMAVASMVLGIISLALFCASYIAIPCAIVAIVLGVVARKRVLAGTGSGKGMATAGIICGVISAALSLLHFPKKRIVC